MIRKNCTECGNEFAVPEPEGLNSTWHRVALAVVNLCESCADLEEEAEREAEAAREAQRRKDRYAVNLADSGLPLDLQRLRFDDLDRDERAPAIDAARDWATGRRKGLVLSGSVGVGKTRIAATATNRMLVDRPVDWVSTARLIIQSKAKLGSGHHGEMERVLLNPRALVLDDIDKVRPTEFTREVIFEAIDSRMTNGLPLLITTNSSYADFAEQFLDSIASRVWGYCDGFGLEGPDRRKA